MWAHGKDRWELTCTSNIVPAVGLSFHRFSSTQLPNQLLWRKKADYPTALEQTSFWVLANHFVLVGEVTLHCPWDMGRVTLFTTMLALVYGRHSQGFDWWWPLWQEGTQWRKSLDGELSSLEVLGGQFCIRNETTTAFDLWEKINKSIILGSIIIRPLYLTEMT